MLEGKFTECCWRTIFKACLFRRKSLLRQATSFHIQVLFTGSPWCTCVISLRFHLILHRWGLKLTSYKPLVGGGDGDKSQPHLKTQNNVNMLRVGLWINVSLFQGHLSTIMTTKRVPTVGQILFFTLFQHENRKHLRQCYQQARQKETFISAPKMWSWIWIKDDWLSYAYVRYKPDFWLCEHTSPCQSSRAV